MREGRAPEVIRRKGAEGSLPVPLGEKIEILVFLSRDQTPGISGRAFETLLDWPAGELQPLLSNPATPREVLEFVANHLTAARPEFIQALLANPALPQELRAGMETKPTAAEPVATPAPGAAPESGEKESQRRQTLLQKISQMSTAEKIRLALLGNQEERLMLIRDANKIVSRTVLQSPKLTGAEIEAIASMKTVTEETLRLIAVNRGFMKRYGVILALVNNPKTPIDVSLPLLNRLNDPDLKGLMINKNVADVLRSIATKMVKRKKEAEKVKFPGPKH